MGRTSLLAFGLILSGFLVNTAGAAEALPPASRWVPADAVVAVEVARPKALLDLALDAKVLDAVLALPDLRKQTATADFRQLQQLVEYLSLQLKTDWKTGLHKLLDGGITLAVGPRGGTLLIVDAEDPALMKQLYDIVMAFAKIDAAKHDKPDQVGSVEYRGTTVSSFGKGECHAILGRRLLVSNRQEVLKAALDLREGSGPALAGLPAYQAARKAAGPDAAAAMYLNLALVKQHPAVQKALSESSNPMGALVLGALLQAARDAGSLALGLNVEGDTLTLKAATDARTGGVASPASFAVPGKGAGALPNITVPRQIAGLSFYRDLHAFYAAKDKLFPERTSSLILFENMMGIFFSGRDLTEDVLGETQPEIRIVVAAQEYKGPTAPQAKIPAFAAVFRTRHPAEFSEVVLEAWQKAVGLVNTTRGQKGQPGLIFDTTTHDDVRFHLAYYSTSKADEHDPLSARLNYRPAIAQVGDYLILSSTDGLTNELIDALKKEAAGGLRPLSRVSDLVELDAAAMAAAMQANRTLLVRQNMLEKGHSQEQAENELDMFTKLADWIGKARLEISAADGQTQAVLRVKLNVH